MTTEKELYDNQGGPVNPPKNKRQRSLNIIFSIVFIILAAAIGFLLYTLLTEREEANEMQVVLEMQKETLATELNEMYMQYDSLETENDSMNVKIVEEQLKIRNLLAIRESNAKKIQIYQTELTTLRKYMQSYIVQIDSLNRTNLRLQAENKQVKSRIAEATSVNKQLEANLKKEQEKVETASEVKISNIIAEPITNNAALARRAKRTDKFRVCCTLNENAIAKQGLKKVYLRIGNPDSRVMVRDVNNVFTFEGEALAFSTFREFQYDGVDLPVCIYYDLEGDDVMPGTYYVDLYMDGEHVKTTSFSLK